MSDFKQIRNAITREEFLDALSALEKIVADNLELKEYQNQIIIFQTRCNSISRKERQRVRSNDETEAKRNQFVQDILNLIEEIEAKTPPSLPSPFKTEIVELYLQNLENFLELKQYKPKLAEDSPIRAYTFLRDMYDIIEPITLTLKNRNLQSMSQVNTLIDDLKIVNKNLDKWIGYLDCTKSITFVDLHYRLVTMKKRYVEFEAECLLKLLGKSSEMTFDSRKISYFSALNSVKIELEKWVGQAIRYRTS